MEFDDPTEVRIQFDVFRVLAAIDHLLDDSLPVQADAQLSSEVEEVGIDQLVDYYSRRAELLIRQVVPDEEMDVLLALFLVQGVLRIVILIFVILVVNLARVIDHAQVDLELLHLVGDDLVLVSAKYDLPFIRDWLRAVLLQNLI